jgi:hypothetical protein
VGVLRTVVPLTPRQKVPPDQRKKGGVKRIENPKPATLRVRAYRERHPDRVRTRQITSRMIANGELIPAPCEVGIDCSGRVEVHHPDYTRPELVRWFCVRHHRMLDGARRATDACGKCGTPWHITPMGRKKCKPCYAIWAKAKYEARKARNDARRASLQPSVA